MAQNSHIGSTAATSYARALLDLANDQGRAQEIGQEMAQIREVLDAEPAFERMIANPSIAGEGLEPLLRRAFEGKVSPLTWNFIRLLAAKNRLSDFRRIEQALDELLDAQFGKVEVDVTVAQRLDDATLEEVRRAVSDALKRDAVVHQYVDESIIGGLVLRVEDKLIDTSVRAQLQALKQQMLAARPRAATL
jgi:F-type H+-transporting ATPase subunit delta